MATKGVQSTPTISGTDGNDFSYRQTIPEHHQASAAAKASIEKLFYAFLSCGLVLIAHTVARTQFAGAPRADNNRIHTIK